MEKLKSLSNDSKVAIIMHDTPDPDAIGSALGMSYLLKTKFNLKSNIFHGGEISHPENKALMNVLGLNFHLLDTSFNTDNYGYIISVDCTPNNIILDAKDVDMVIDHHQVKVNSDDYDLVSNDGIGAACSLVYELLKQHQIKIEEEDCDVATALLFGIIRDTNHLLSDRTTKRDFDAYKELSEIANKKSINEIQEYPIPGYIFQLESTATQEGNYIEKDATFASFIGHISSTKRDALPILADKYMRKEGIVTAVVAAVVNDQIEASVRSSNVSVVVDSFVKDLFGEQYAGGKRGAGAAKAPLGFLGLSEIEDKEIETEMIDIIKKILFSKVIKKIKNDT